MFRGRVRFHHLCLFAVVVIALCPGCRTAERKAQVSLEEAGIRSTASTLLDAMQNDRHDEVDLMLEAGLPDVELGSASRLNLVAAAIIHNRSDVARELLKLGVTVHRSEPSVLAVALAKDQLEIVQMALQLGANPHSKSISGESLIPWCILTGRYAAAHLLLDYGAAIDDRDAKGRSSVSLCVEKRRPALLSRLLDGSGRQFSERRIVGTGPLTRAMENGDTEVFSLLLEAGASPLETDALGRPLLFRALREGRDDLADALITAGADIDVRFQGARALDHALVEGDREQISSLLMRGASPVALLPDGTPPLSAALAERDFDLVYRLLRFGAPLRNTLAEVAARNDTRAARILLDHGALRQGATPPHSHPPLLVAMQNGHDEMLETLVDAGADLNVRVAGIPSFFHYALIRCDTAMVKLLLAEGADPNEPFPRNLPKHILEQLPFDGFSYFLRRDSRVTPLMLAASSGKVELAEALLSYGAKIGKRTGRTKLWTINFASRRSDVPMMRLLLGADPRSEKRKIVVDLSDQRTWVYQGDKVIFSSPISSGKKGHRTKSGTFAITNKYRHWNSTIYGSSMPHFQRFSCGDFGFHAGRLPGYPASAGCIRLPAGKARQLFALTELGDRVIIRR